MSENTQSQPTVLIVDDEEGLTDLYAAWLEDRYEIRTAYNGEMALEQVDDAVDIVLLDRRMPGLSGDQVLTELRDRGYDCPVAIVSAVDPDIDLALLRFNDYVSKPVDKDELIKVIETLLQRVTYSKQIERYTALLTKKVLLDQELSDSKIQASEDYDQLQTEVEQAREAADETLDRLLESGDIDDLFRDMNIGEYL